MRSFESSQPYLDYLDEWMKNLPACSAQEVFAQPETCAVVSVDIIKGFCSVGPLASPRVDRIVEPAARLLQSAWASGVHNILLSQDTHEPDAMEFGAFPPHCVRGSEEAETVDAIRALPFFDQITVLPKNSISSSENTGLEAWLAAHPQVTTFVVVGDCTDLCVYQLAMFLRTGANAAQALRRVILPVDCVDTYDTPVELAQKIGAQPHDAPLLHAVFLHSMATNGVEVVKSLQ